MCGPYGAQWPGKLLRSPAVTQYGKKTQNIFIYFYFYFCFFFLLLYAYFCPIRRERAIVSYGKYCSVVKKNVSPPQSSVDMSDTLEKTLKLKHYRHKVPRPLEPQFAENKGFRYGGVAGGWVGREVGGWGVVMVALFSFLRDRFIGSDLRHAFCF